MAHVVFRPDTCHSCARIACYTCLDACTHRLYERAKEVRGEYDVADLTAHLHAQLARHGYPGAPFRYVYVDEVQDLTPAQIALFRWAPAYAVARFSV